MKFFFTLIFILTGFGLFAQPPGWLYNQQILVQNGNAVNATNYQLKITVNTQSLIAANQMNSNGSDIRFSGTCSGTSFYNYWIEGGINTATTTIWIKIPLITAGGSTVIYMSYGNTAATAVSSIPGTFRGPNSSVDSLTGGNITTTSGLSQRGFRFAPTQDLLVTQFGKLEPSGTTRYVTLFDFNSQAIITQTQVAGVSTISYTYGNISNPTWLTQNTQYLLELYQGSTDAYYYQTSSQVGQHLTFYDMRYCNSCTQNTFPTTVLGGLQYGYPDFLYYITNTLAITPTYTLVNSIGSVVGPTVLCSGSNATLTANMSVGSYSWNTGSTSSVIVVAPTTSTVYYLTSPSNTLMCPGVSITVSGGLPSLSVISSPSVCLGQTVNLTASGALTYTLSNNLPNGAAFSPSVTANYTVYGTNGCGTSNTVTTITVAPLPVVIAASSTLVCSGTAATLTAGGATNYTWTSVTSSATTNSVIISPAASVIYTLNGVAGPCSGNTVITISTKPNPIIGISSSNTAICNGQQTSLSVTGNAQTYTWNPVNQNGLSITVSPTTTTLYSVIGTSSVNCVSSANAVVIVYSNPTVNATAANPIVCAGGSATLTASGANNYLWNTLDNNTVTVVNPTSNSSYTVIGTDTHSCVGAASVSVAVLEPTIGVSSNTSICAGSAVIISASGADSYAWSNNSSFQSITISPSLTTVYTVTGSVTDPNSNIVCNATNSVMVTVNSNPTITATASHTVICLNNSAVLTADGAGGSGTYTWTGGSGAMQSASISVSPITNQTYTVSGTDANGCKGTSSLLVQVAPCTGIKNFSAGSASLVIYPNPSNGEFTVTSDQNITLQITSELGQQVKTITLGNANHEIKVSNLANGVYFITGANENGSVKEKIIIAK